MMSYLVDVLDRGEDIGHYGQLTVAMVAHYFVDNDELAQWLSKDGDTDEQQARPWSSRSRRGVQPAAARAHPRVAGAAGLPDLP